METEVPVHSGFLIVPTQSGFSLNKIKKVRRGSSVKRCDVGVNDFDSVSNEFELTFEIDVFIYSIH